MDPQPIHVHTGVPLLYINRNTLVLEGVSDDSRDQAEQVIMQLQKCVSFFSYRLEQRKHNLLNMKNLYWNLWERQNYL